MSDEVEFCEGDRVRASQQNDIRYGEEGSVDVVIHDIVPGKVRVHVKFDKDGGVLSYGPEELEHV